MATAATASLPDRITPTLVAMLAYYTAASFATLTNIEVPIWIMATVYAAPLLLLSVALLGLGAHRLVHRKHARPA